MRRAWIGVFVLLGACAKVIGANFDDVEPLAGDASTGSCKLAHPPESTITTPAGGEVELWLIARTFNFGENSNNGGAEAPSQGFDIDGVCTGPNENKPCGPASYTKGDPSDGPGGVDNAV